MKWHVLTLRLKNDFRHFVVTAPAYQVEHRRSALLCPPRGDRVVKTGRLLAVSAKQARYEPEEVLDRTGPEVVQRTTLAMVAQGSLVPPSGGGFSTGCPRQFWWA